MAGGQSPAMARAAVIDRARNDRHAAALTLSRSAVVWNEDRAAERRVDQAFAGAGFDELAVEDERSEEHTSELQSRQYLVCRLLLEKKKNQTRVDYGIDDGRLAVIDT